MNVLNVSETVIRRLPKYYRHLEILKDDGVKRVSSSELSKLTGFTASQIRQDFNNFGGFGQQGYGYNVESLFIELRNILGLDKEYKTIITGAGNLGQAIAKYQGFKESGFEVLSLFDINPTLIGLNIRGISILNVDLMEEYIRRNEVEIGVITTPWQAAKEIADRYIDAGIKAIWNFSPIDIQVPDDIIIENVRLDESLFILSFFLNQYEKKQ